MTLKPLTLEDKDVLFHTFSSMSNKALEQSKVPYARDDAQILIGNTKNLLRL